MVAEIAFYASPGGQNIIHPMTRILRSTYRYKRPPRKRQAVALDEPLAAFPSIR
jgi:hypothetical protein